jgi:hypothetical protein
MRSLCCFGGFPVRAGKHSIENVATDGNFRLLGLERPSPKAPSDEGLVSPDGGLDQRALAVTGGGLPFHPAVSADYCDMPIPVAERLLVGRSIALARGGMTKAASAL